MNDVGLNYLTLGQPLSTLSGGECQRIKLASELHKQGSIYVLDEPTTGLHMSDISHLLAIINRLVDAGNTVIIIEHNVSLIKNADWIIDMGPEGGSKGGQVMFEGTRETVTHRETIAYKRIFEKTKFALRRTPLRGASLRTRHRGRARPVRPRPCRFGRRSMAR